MRAHCPTSRQAVGSHAIGHLLLNLFASLPRFVLRGEDVSRSQETDCVISAIRWLLDGSARERGLLRPLPDSRSIAVGGSSQLRFAGGHIVEEPTVFDAFGAHRRAYRR